MLSAALCAVNNETVEELVQKRDRLIKNNPECDSLIRYFELKKLIEHGNNISKTYYYFSCKLQLLFENNKITEEELAKSYHCLLVARAICATQEKLKGDKDRLQDAENNYKSSNK